MGFQSCGIWQWHNKKPEGGAEKAPLAQNRVKTCKWYPTARLVKTRRLTCNS